MEATKQANITELLSTLNEVRGEISRLNRSFGETVFNPAVTQMVESAQAALAKVKP